MDFEQVTGASTSVISTVFVFRGILAIFGSLILGPLLDKVNHYVVVGISLTFDFVLHGAVPWCSSLAAILTTLAPPEFFNCAIGMGKPFACSLIKSLYVSILVYIQILIISPVNKNRIMRIMHEY